jgi:uncharacterized protein YbjT (DUF2867 family)
MSVVAVTGGTGTVGASIVAALTERGHEVRVLSRSSSSHPVDLGTGAGLVEALSGCEVVVDASNGGPKPDAARRVLVEGGARLLDEERRAGIAHHVCISIVGIERVPMRYYEVKVEQERQVERSGQPYSILRATQFHASIAALFRATSRFRVLPGARALLCPIDPLEVAEAVADVVAEGPLAGRRSITGPERAELRELASVWRELSGRRALIVPTPIPGALGRALRSGALVGDEAELRGETTFRRWLQQQPSPGPGSDRAGAGSRGAIRH